MNLVPTRATQQTSVVPTPRISVVIPAYNRRECVLALLGDLAHQEGTGFDVVVVDDHSSDGTADAIAARFPEVTILRNETNRGPAAARNRGIRHASGDLIVGFDSDVSVPDRGLLARVAQAFDHTPEATGFAFRILQKDGVADDAPRWWHPVPLRGWASLPFCTSYFSGTAYAFRRDAMISAGLFPEILFMHYEEVQLAYRVLDAGGTLCYRPELSVRHHAHEVSRRSEVRTFYKPRNQVLLAVACLPLYPAVRYLIPRLIFQACAAARHGHLKKFLAAMRDANMKSKSGYVERKPLKAATLRRLALLCQG